MSPLTVSPWDGCLAHREGKAGVFWRPQSGLLQAEPVFLVRRDRLSRQDEEIGRHRLAVPGDFLDGIGEKDLPVEFPEKPLSLPSKGLGPVIAHFPVSGVIVHQRDALRVRWGESDRPQISRRSRSSSSGNRGGRGRDRMAEIAIPCRTPRGGTLGEGPEFTASSGRRD